MGAVGSGWYLLLHCMRVTMCNPGRHEGAQFHNHWEEALISTSPSFCRRRR